MDYRQVKFQVGDIDHFTISEASKSTSDIIPFKVGREQDRIRKI